MQELSVFFSADSELSEYEAVSKGYRVDVHVKIDDEIYNLRAYTLVRLQQDFETEHEMSGYYCAEPNIVLVRDANKIEIINTVNNLFLQGYFSSIRPTKGIDVSLLVKVQ